MSESAGRGGAWTKERALIMRIERTGRSTVAVADTT
jgi:hypothetical protein